MRLSALLLSLVIGLGLTAPLDAKTKAPKAPKQSAGFKMPKHKGQRAKIKPMKFRKGKGKGFSKAPKRVKSAKIKTHSA